MNREKILELVREFAKEEYSNKEFIEGKEMRAYIKILIIILMI